MAEDRAIYYGTGRRKTSVARVRLTPGSGEMTVNGRPGSDYFGRKALVTLAEQPFVATETQGRFDVIVHGCNCFHTMKKGLARDIASAFPEALAADLRTPYGDYSKLGSLSHARCERPSGAVTVVNAYTQFDWRGSGLKADYRAISSAFKRIAAQFGNCRIAYPRIGAGLANGDWNIIAPIIERDLEGCDHSLVQLPQKR